MKFLYLIIFSSISFSQNMDYWVDEFQERIYFVPRVEMNISLILTKVSSQKWGRLVIDTQYTDEGLNNDPEYLKLKEKYSDFSFQAINSELNFSEIAEIRLSVLGKKKKVQLRPGVLGPYFHAWFDLNKNETQKIREMALGKKKLVEINAELFAQFKINMILEKYEISNAICEKLFSQGSSTYEVFQQYFLAVDKIKETSFKYLSTYKDLKNQILNRCLMQDLNIQINSFDDLLKLKLYQNDESETIEGRTIEIQRRRERIKLKLMEVSYEELD